MKFLLTRCAGGALDHHMSMHRQTVTLTDPQAEFLRTEAARLGISVSDLIRRIIDQHREDKSHG